jgi:CHAD domain-containing protein
VALDAELLTLPARDGARLLALSYLRAARKARRRLLRGGDPEALHDFRVALRHLRSALRAYRPYLGQRISKKTRRRLREIVGATRECRDLEVQIAWLLQQRPELTADQGADVDLWLVGPAGQHAQAARQLRKVVRKRLPKLRRRLTTELRAPAKCSLGYGAGPGECGAVVMSRLVERLAGELQQSVQQVHAITDVAEAHQARVTAKRLRYLLEPIADRVDGAAVAVRELTALQDTLGELHDAHLREAELNRACAETGAGEASAAIGTHPGLHALAARARAVQAEAFAAFQQTWSPAATRAFLARLEDTATRLPNLPHAGEAERP